MNEVHILNFVIFITIELVIMSVLIEHYRGHMKHAVE